MSASTIYFNPPIRGWPALKTWCRSCCCLCRLLLLLLLMLLLLLLLLAVAKLSHCPVVLGPAMTTITC